MMDIKKKTIKRFWKINIVTSTIMFFLFLLTVFLLFNNIVNLDVDIIYFQILMIIICLSVIQFIICLIYYLIKIKQHSFWKVFALIYFIILIFLEVRLSFGIIGGFLGDT